MNPAPSSPENRPASDDNLLALGKGALQSAGGGRPPPWQPPTPEELQAMLPPGYAVIGILGRGGMGAVYLARQLSLDRPVAIKILPDDLDDASSSFAERFKNEARAMAQLNHPGIVAVYDFGQTANGLLYIVMEFIDGTDVQQMVARQGRLHSAHAMAITAHVCDALAYAHSRGIIHRDIKPSNIMINQEGVVKVADFGLAKVSQDGQTAGLTQSGVIMGTLHFMAPEALMLGTAVDQRADIYAVGVMLYQMLTGRLPQGLFEMPSMQVSGLDPRYDGIVAKALREDRALRYQNAGELRHDLDAILTQPVVKVQPEVPQAPAAVPAAPPPGQVPKRAPGQAHRPPQRSQPQPVKKKTGIMLMLVGAAVILAALGAFFFLGGEGGGTTADPKQATKDSPFTNSLGMKFVPVPGTKVLFCIHETRRQDYEVYARDASDVANAWNENSRDGVPVQTGPDHPVVNVNWDESNAFCEWLSKKEGRKYRLATDREWSFAVGIGDREDPNATPESLRQRIPDTYPWGDSWPPPNGSGNFADESSKDRFSPKRFIIGYNDGYDSSSPVMAFPANALGIHDLAGNTWQWCADVMSPKNPERVRRGSAWIMSETRDLLSSHRPAYASWLRDGYTSFRVVLDLSEATSPTATAQTPAEAANDKPFANSLGMKFVPVPITGGPTDGQHLLFSIWETRVQDYEAFALDTGRKWSKPGFTQDPTHPAVMLNWDDVTAFCSWLTLKEHASGSLAPGEEYRLPSDHEWSCAAGIGGREDPLMPPKAKESKLPGYMWGDQWPPPAGTGNFADESLGRARGGDAARTIQGFDDGFPFTAPVGSFAPNSSGLFDLSGSAWEWVEDWYDEPTEARALRGASWNDPWARQGLWLSDRHGGHPSSLDKVGTTGFRCVRAPVKAQTNAIATHVPPRTGSNSSGQSSAGAATAPVARSPAPPMSATKEQPFMNSLGMKFVPVPQTNVLFSIWETRFRDYEPFARANPAEAERKPPGWTDMVFDQGADHPVGAVRWTSAVAFCEWLTKKEMAAGVLPSGALYRLPKDAEWLRAAADELDNPTPNHPPGNFADESLHRKTPDLAWIRGFDDGFPATSPVGSFAANRLGIHDLLGNVWEWCEEFYDPSAGGNHLLRGGACSVTGFGRHGAGNVVDGEVGFRIVLELPVPAKTSPTAPTQPVPPPSGPTTWTDNKGRSITAAFKGIAGDKLLLDIAGKVTPVALNTLSAQSQKLARDYQFQLGAGTDTAQSAGSTMPSLTKPAAPQPPPAAVPQTPAISKTNPKAGRIVIYPLAESGNVSPVGAGAFDAKHKDTLFVDVAAFDHHVIAVTAAGEVVRWGSEAEGGPLKESVPVVEKRAVTCSAARFRDFIIYEDGSLHVMGAKENLNIPEGRKITHIFQYAWCPGIYARDDAGHLHFIGAGADRAIYDVPASLKNVAVKDLKVSDHIVALTQAGEVVVWGRTGFKQLPLPADLQKGGKAIAIGVDGPTSFAVLASGKISVWGHLLNEWLALADRAKNAQDAWLLRDGYWAAIVFPQAGSSGSTYEICAKDKSRNEYLAKILRRHRPSKLAWTQDALILIESP